MAQEPSVSVWHAVDVSVAGVTNNARVLWQNDDGRIRLWTVNNSTGGVLNSYADGPYPGWTVKAIASGPDGNTRLLWVHPSGVLSLHIITASGQALPYHQYGPYPDNAGLWLPVDVSVMQTGTSNSTRILWTRSDGAISLWTLDANGNLLSSSDGGPWPGWKAKAIGVGTDGQTRTVWNHTNGVMSSTVSSVAVGPSTGTQYGPFPAGSNPTYQADDIAVGNDGAGDNSGRILWNNNDGSISLWTTNPAGALTAYAEHAVQLGWKAKAIALQLGGQTRILWSHQSGVISLWQTQTSGAYGSHFGYNSTPANFTATAGPARIALSWTASEHATSYNIYRAASSNGPFNFLNSSTITNYNDTTGTPNTAYFYKVTTVTAGVESGSTAVVTAVPNPAPAVITSVDNEGTKLRVRWNHSNPPASTYSIWRSGTVDGSYASVDSSTSTDFLDTTTAPGVKYFYKVSNYNSANQQTLYSEAVGKMTLTAIPTNVVATAGNGVVSLIWDAVSGAHHYWVFRSTTSGGSYIYIGSPPYGSRNYNDYGLTNGQTYYYRIEAANSENTGGGQSAPVSATPTAVTPTPTPVATATPLPTATPGPTATPTPNPSFGAPQNLVATGKYKKSNCVGTQ